MIETFSKFKRLFVFGCSYTNYLWPTWAEVLHSEMPDSEFYNFGRIGSGNLFISLRVAEANRRFEFTDTDLVCVMWTSFTREDRWIDGGWTGQGNILNQSLYPDSWVKEFVDIDGYLIRDFGLIELTKSYLQNLDCTSVMMSAWPFQLIENNKFNINTFSSSIEEECMDLYKDTIKDIPLDIRSWTQQVLFKDMSNVDFHNYGHTYERSVGKFKDGHPNPVTYYEYLKYLNFPLTQKSVNYSKTKTDLLHRCKSESEILELFSKKPNDYRIF